MGTDEIFSPAWAKEETLNATTCMLAAVICLVLTRSGTGQSTAALGIEIKNVVNSGVLSVEMRNRSSDTLKLWNDSNSWGSATWRVMRIRDGHLETFFQNPDQIFTRNIPTFRELHGGTSIQVPLALNEGNWCGFGHSSSFDERGIGGQEVAFEANDTIIVSYDVPNSTEAKQRGVWYGVAASLFVRPAVRAR